MKRIILQNQITSIDHESLLTAHEGSSWMYFTAKPRCEKALYGALRSQGVPCYLPMIRKTTEYTHRIYTRMVPMFPGYVFASTTSQSFDLRKINSFLNRVFFLSPHDSEKLLKDLRTVHKYELLAQKRKVDVLNIALKDPVLITHGIFKGERAVIQHFNDHDEVTIQLDAVPYSLNVCMPLDFVTKEV